MTLFKDHIISALTESLGTSTSSKVCWPSATELVGSSMTIWGALLFGEKKKNIFFSIEFIYVFFLWHGLLMLSIHSNTTLLFYDTQHLAFVSSFCLRSQPDNSGSESKDSTKRLWPLSSFFCFSLLMLIILFL